MDKINNAKIREHFNQSISRRYSGDYEFNRWFNDRRTRLDFFMTYNSIKFALGNFKFDSCLEIGPGPGTWTKVLFRQSPEAKFDLIDISEEMKRQFFLEMRNQSNVNYIVADIAEYDLNKKYDLLFSSRAIEYFDDKDLFLKKAYNSLNLGARGIIITKHPEQVLFGKLRETRWQHSAQISPADLTKKLLNAGFKNIGIYPVVIRLSFLDRFSDMFSEKLYMKCFNLSIERTKPYFIESYMAIFDK